MRLRLQSNNQPLGSSIVLADTGEVIHGVESAVWTCDGVDVPKLILTLTDFDMDVTTATSEAATGGQP